MKRTGTTWTNPKRNWLAGINDLRNCLASGHNARLIKEWNENCEHPIQEPNPSNSIQVWESKRGGLTSINDILSYGYMSDKEKAMTIDYVNCFGTREAVDHYYKTGGLSTENFRGVGIAHLVKRQHAIDFFSILGDYKMAEKFVRKELNKKYWFDFVGLKNGYSKMLPKRFKRKIWVVQILSNSPKQKAPFMVNLLNWVLAPLKYIPTRSVLNMKEYKTVTYRIGDVTNGFSIEFHIPKKFSFK